MALKPISAFLIDRSADLPVGRQIYGLLRRNILDGRLSPGERLPASRTLAIELAVSRATIVGVYDQLIAEGFAQGRRGSGVYVSDIGQLEFIESSAPSKLAQPAPKGRLQHPTPFQPGRPDLRIFPHRQWAQCIARLARRDPEMLIGGGPLFGDEQLRTAIAGHLAEWRGLSVSRATGQS